MRTALLISVSFLAYGQTFDAASIKPFVQANGPRMFFFGGGRGGPGSSDPGRISYPMITIKNLLMNAYDVKEYQISGPEWLGSERFVVEATMPPETTKPQFRTMLQNLLAERFKVAIHRETKDMQKYSLTVAKNGPKLKEAAEAPEESTKKEDAPPPPPPPPGGRGPLKMGPDGFPVLPAMGGGRGGLFMMMTPIGTRLMGQKQTMQDLVERLSNLLSKPVTDETALKGKYDFTLTFSMDGLNNAMLAERSGGDSVIFVTLMAPPPGEGGRGRGEMPDVEPPQNLFAAIQSQLGLKLDAKKGPVDLIVVDHAEKTPTEN
jgi:uncharacterized protein (TIGR03435 family)